MREESINVSNLTSPDSFYAAELRYSASGVNEPQPSGIYIRESIPSFSEVSDDKKHVTKRHKKRRDQRKSFSCRTSNEGIIIGNRKDYRKRASHHAKLRILPKTNILKIFSGLRSDKNSVQKLKAEEHKVQSLREHSNDDNNDTTLNQALDQVSNEPDSAINALSAPSDTKMAAWDFQQSTCSAFIPLEPTLEPVHMEKTEFYKSALDQVDCTFAIMFMPWSSHEDDIFYSKSVDSDLENNSQFSVSSKCSDINSMTYKVKESSTTCSSSFPVSSCESDTTSPSSKSTPVSRRKSSRVNNGSVRSLLNWVPDSHSRTCQSCATSFRLTRRRHHCRLCGMLVCWSCSQYNTYVVLPQSPGIKKERFRAPWSKRKKVRRKTTHGSSFSPEIAVVGQDSQRTCRKCANTLHHMAMQGDTRVHKLVSHKKSENLLSKTSSNMRDNTERECLRAPSSVSESLCMFDQQFMVPSCVSNLMQIADGLSKRQELDRIRKSTSKFLSSSIISNVSFIGERNSVALLEESLFRPPRCSRPNNVHLISSNWLQGWLSYMNLSVDLTQNLSDSLQFDQCTRKRPGPIANYDLLDFVDGKLQLCKHVAAKVLSISNVEDKCITTLSDIKYGYLDKFGIISEDMWVALHEIYGGGPTICSSVRSGFEESRIYERACLTGPAMQDWIILEDESLLFYEPQINKSTKSWFKHKRCAQKTSRHSMCIPPTSTMPSRQHESSTTGLADELVEGGDFPGVEQDLSLSRNLGLSRINSWRLLLSFNQSNPSPSTNSETRLSNSLCIRDQPLGKDTNSAESTIDPVKDVSLKHQINRKSDRLYLAQTGARIGLSTHKFKVDEKKIKSVSNIHISTQKSRNSSQAIHFHQNRRSRAHSGEPNALDHDPAEEPTLARRMTVGAEEDLEADTIAPVQAEVRGSLAAVTAFATACAEARKKSARSLARYSRSDSLILELTDCADGSTCA
uniref:AlNc14C7G927 protein n=1 Tax=Albugo laibachii Nc14 TaxID=890382 RepID=F0W1F8_9STRA|nr:AlNc14C7G927 [Albugo laibachii Nc14]|eukprot:CCA14887.1 AlNc14C7G927 [Albugo laibachii Nc14]